MNEDILISCDICGNIFNPGILNESYSYGHIVVCDACYNDPMIRLKL